MVILNKYTEDFSEERRKPKVSFCIIDSDSGDQDINSKDDLIFNVPVIFYESIFKTSLNYNLVYFKSFDPNNNSASVLVSQESMGRILNEIDFITAQLNNPIVLDVLKELRKIAMQVRESKGSTMLKFIGTQ